MTSNIELKGLSFFAHHGLYAEEREKGSWFKVDVSFFCNAVEAIKNDEITGTVNYEEIYRIVAAEMKIPSKLIEHVAGRIYNRIQTEVVGVNNLQITLYKLEAPLGGPLDYVSIHLGE
jgi:dihydroneopterin aldolase